MRACVCVCVLKCALAYIACLYVYDSYGGFHLPFRIDVHFVVLNYFCYREAHYVYNTAIPHTYCNPAWNVGEYIHLHGRQFCNFLFIFLF